MAAYCRVNARSWRNNSPATRRRWILYDGIMKNPGWKFAGIYADEGISGTPVQKIGQASINWLTTAWRKQDWPGADKIHQPFCTKHPWLHFNTYGNWRKKHRRVLRKKTSTPWTAPENFLSPSSETLPRKKAVQQAPTQGGVWSAGSKKDGVMVENHNKFLGYTKRMRPEAGDCTEAEIVKADLQRLYLRGSKHRTNQKKYLEGKRH